MIKKMVLAGALVTVVGLGAAPAAHAETPAYSAADQKTNNALIAKADAMTVQPDKKSPRVRTSTRLAAAASDNGAYPSRKGVILATSDALKGLIPTGHAAMVYGSSTIIESNSAGVVWGANDWAYTRQKAYAVTVDSTSEAQDAAAAEWTRAQLGKGYNYNFLNTSTRSKFYCSQLVWAAFKDKFGINLDTSAFLWAIHPMELVSTPKTRLVWSKS